MKLSKLTPEQVARYLRLDEETLAEDIQPRLLLKAAKSYIRGFTGLSDEEIDRHEDLTLAALVLCAEFYENRTLSVDAAHQNRAVDAILSMYRTNLL